MSNIIILCLHVNCVLSEGGTARSTPTVTVVASRLRAYSYSYHFAIKSATFWFTPGRRSWRGSWHSKFPSLNDGGWSEYRFSIFGGEWNGISFMFICTSNLHPDFCMYLIHVCFLQNRAHQLPSVNEVRQKLRQLFADVLSQGWVIC